MNAHWRRAKIDQSIQDIEQARSQRPHLAAKGTGAGPLRAAHRRIMAGSPGITQCFGAQLRFGNDGLLTVVLAAPNADSINKALLAIQQDGYRITATPRQDA